ncbi:DUF928 domain-containing protein [Fortiea contorta]|uniref:DUF928 domain-containing protein n=1 Tax=Fortiea contorta TaxID=1892405 RepID=UPI00036591C1|nr:DUF928 domain-containing protein [Fortiea contorta]
MKNHIQITSVLTLIFLVNFPQAIASPVKLVPPRPDRQASASPVKFVPPPPPDRGAAGDRGGAASRGCGNNNQSLMAIVPVYEQTINQQPGQTVSVTKVWGLTTSEHPSFWFFVPYNISAIASTEFILKDESQKSSKTIYKTTVASPPTPGIINIRLPSNIPPLQTEKMYRWFFKLKVKCDTQQTEQLQYAEGWIQRMKPNSSLAELLPQTTPQQQIGLYAENGIWYDALSTLAELRLAKPQDPTLTAQWTSLLNSAGLENLVSQPLVNLSVPQR